jgi:hypothetical protein
MQSILEIPDDAFKLVVKMLLDWHPEIKELSALINNSLFRYLVEDGLITSADIEKMLAEANTPALKHAANVLAGPFLMPNEEEVEDEDVE